MTASDTIYALSTAPGRAGIAVVRLSGPASALALQVIAGGLPPARRFAFRTLRSANGETIDQAVAIWLPAPGTETGEDMVEFQLHGSPAIVSALMEELALIPNCRPAVAGEFIRRSFVNGKMDLVEVEGLADLLVAETSGQRRLAMRQFLGETSAAFEAWRSKLIEALAMAEAAIDFSDEYGVAEAARQRVLPVVSALVGDLEAALQASAQAGLVRDGMRLVIAGPPNAGKSSLLNWFAKRDAAIVSAIAGTTRDVIETRVMFAGFPVMISDTAGLRESGSDEIEAIGMARAEVTMRDADLVLWVTAPDADAELPVWLAGSVFQVRNKADLHPEKMIHIRNDSIFTVSVRSGEGLDRLHDAVVKWVRVQGTRGESSLIVRERHRHAVAESIRILNDVVKDRTLPIEMLAEKLRLAARCLGSLTGRVDVEDLLGKIFSEFCIGK